MKYRDVFIQILSEVSGRSKADLTEMLRLAAEARPEMNAGFDKELSEEEAQSMLAKLRNEKEGIAAWLVQGAMAVNSAAPRTKKTQ